MLENLFFGDVGDGNRDRDVGNDPLLGRVDADTLDGLAGDDRLDGSLGADNLFGGTGNDALCSPMIWTAMVRWRPPPLLC